MKEQDSRSSSRREFLKTGAAVGAGAAASTLLPGVAAAAEVEAPAPTEAKKGYQLTQHVLDYYRTAKL
jgi:anaerobic selenocysteine-containing dehydrogenase